MVQDILETGDGVQRRQCGGGGGGGGLCHYGKWSCGVSEGGNKVNTRYNWNGNWIDFESEREKKQDQYEI